MSGEGSPVQWGKVIRSAVLSHEKWAVSLQNHIDNQREIGSELTYQPMPCNKRSALYVRPLDAFSPLTGNDRCARREDEYASLGSFHHRDGIGGGGGVRQLFRQYEGRMDNERRGKEVQS